MEKTIFYQLGQFIHKFRWQVIIFWLLMLASCLPFIPHIISPFQTTGFVAEHSKSDKATQYLNDALGYGTNRFLIIYNSKDLVATSKAYKQKIKKSLAGLADFPIPHEIIYPDMNEKQISKDKHTAYVVVLIKSKTPIAREHLKRFVDSIKKPRNMTMNLGGEPIFVESISKQTQTDLLKADSIAAPVSVIILIVVFGSIIAALLPMVLGGGCALIILTLLFALAHVFTLSIFTINIALLLGLCLSLDYALFIISRFRHEYHQNKNTAEVIAITLATAGRAIFYSGLAVFISLSALLLFPINILFSVGVGGLSAVFIAVSIAVTLLPAVLSVLQHKVNWLAVRSFKQVNATKFQFWRSLAQTVIKRPLLYFFSALFILLLLGYPFMNAKFGISDVNILPEHSESHQFFDLYKENFNEKELTPIQIIITTPNSRILTKSNVSKLYNFAQKLKDNPAVEQINSIVTTDNKLKKAQYQMLYASDQRESNEDVKMLLKTSTRKNMTVINVVSKYPADAEQTKQLIDDIQRMQPGKGMNMQLTGVPVNNRDVLETISKIFPYALAWIMILTYLVLLVLLRSLFLPFKALLMNILSLCASYGVLVFVFQEGHLHQLLNFTPQGIVDISLLIIIFCALFGFSMDYEVFLLTRIHENYLIHGKNEESIVFGIEHSSRIITSAAMIVIFICGSFMFAEVLMVKEFGLGIAVAIFVDAFIVRTILVPSTMVLLKKWNWYLPKWLDKLIK